MAGDFDVVIIGAGAAGFSAGLYCANRGLKTVMLEGEMPGAQIMNCEFIENFPGMPAETAGADLVAQLQEQAMNAGAELAMSRANTIRREDPYRIVETDDGQFRAKAVIIAAGSALRKLNVPGEEALLGRGVSSCATCDGPFFKDAVVAVVGDGDSAADEALTLTSYASKVLLIQQGATARAQDYLQQRVRASAKIQVLSNSVVDEILGDDKVTGVHVKDQSPRRERQLDVSGVFVFIGLEPNTQFLSGLLKTDEAGHIPVDAWMETEVAGVYAAGDIRQHSARQLASASGDGATAAVAAHRYIKGRDAHSFGRAPVAASAAGAA
jgi:thioredoxin reductase (NADPH)